MIHRIFSFLTLGLRGRKRDMLDLLGMQLEDVCSHLIAIGGSGSGKTSFLKVFLIDVLKRGGSTCGALFAAVKPDEFEHANRVIEAAGAGDRLVHLQPGKFTYNFLAYELSRPGGSPQTASDLLDDLSRLANDSGSDGEAQFWKNLFQKMAVFAITICWLAKRAKVTVEDVYNLITSSPSSFEQVASETFRKRSYCFQMLCEAEAGLRDDPERRQFKMAAAFFTDEAITIGDKPRGAAISQVSAVLGPFLQGSMYSTVCCDTSSFSPLDAITGKCVVMDAPVMTHGDAGKFIQALITKQVLQACLARTDSEYMTLIVRDELPVIVGKPSDEVANMALARSTRTAFISGIQSNPTLQSSMGGNQAEQELHSVLSNYATKIVLSTACPRTAEFFSNAWGNFRDQFVSVSEEKADREELNLFNMLTDDHLIFSVNEQLVPRCPVESFLALKRGGDANQRLVEFFLSQAGRVYGPAQSPFTRLTFKQI